MAEVLIFAVTVFGFALVSKVLVTSPLTGPMVFTTVGLVVGVAGWGWFELTPDGATLSVLVQATLALVLFTDAARIRLGSVRQDALIPARLLGIGLPLTLVAGTVAAGAVFTQLSWAEALLLAAVLTPTDAALGQSVVSDDHLPVRVRQSLNIESGLNDGIMVPVVTVALALVAAGERPEAGGWIAFAFQQIGFGVVSGVVVGGVGGFALDRFARAGRVDGAYRQLATLALAAAAFATADLAGGSGLVSAFVAGMVFGVVAEQPPGAQDFTQDEGDLLTAITLLFFGSVVAGPVFGELTWRVAAYVALSLTVVRMVPVLLALAGSGTLLRTRLFIAWFGPRGLASLLFALLVTESLTGDNADLIFVTAVWTVLVSVYVHGLTAGPLASRLGAVLARMPHTQAENAPSPWHPTRRRLF